MEHMIMLPNRDYLSTTLSLYIAFYDIESKGLIFV